MSKRTCWQNCVLQKSWEIQKCAIPWVFQGLSGNFNAKTQFFFLVIFFFFQLLFIQNNLLTMMFVGYCNNIATMECPWTTYWPKEIHFLLHHDLVIIKNSSSFQSFRKLLVYVLFVQELKSVHQYFSFFQGRVVNITISDLRAVSNVWKSW